jgi:hypothetical protein
MIKQIKLEDSALLHLPVDIKGEIFNKLSFQIIALCSVVCKQLNVFCFQFSKQRYNFHIIWKIKINGYIFGGHGHQEDSITKWKIIISNSDAKNDERDPTSKKEAMEKKFYYSAKAVDLLPFITDYSKVEGELAVSLDNLDMIYDHARTITDLCKPENAPIDINIKDLPLYGGVLDEYFFCNKNYDDWGSEWGSWQEKLTLLDASTGIEITVNNLWKNGNNNPRSGATDNISPDLLHHITKLRTLLVNVYKVKRTNLQCEAL